jgi:hypothetical protein
MDYRICYFSILLYLCAPICSTGQLIGLADVVKLVDTLDLGSSAERCAGSSPSIRTFKVS